MMADTSAGQRMLVIFHGRDDIGEGVRAARLFARPPLCCGPHRGGKSRDFGGYAVKDEAEEQLPVQPRQDSVAALVRKAVEMAKRLPALEEEFDLPTQTICSEALISGQPRR